jgi:hypothetical protein
MDRKRIQRAVVPRAAITYRTGGQPGGGAEIARHRDRLMGAAVPPLYAG